VGLAAVIAPVALFFAAGGEVRPPAGGGESKPVAEDVAPCCMEIVSAAPIANSWVISGAQLIKSAAPAAPAVAARYRVAAAVPELLPKGDASESGLQVKTILAARAISAAFPEIEDIGGVRPDPLPWHPNGLAIDVTIPNPGTAVRKNAARFAMQDAIWRGTYYTPNGSQAGGYGHYDHVHITTTGGGYPEGGEVYYR
jgi:hypothetical protein